MDRATRSLAALATAVALALPGCAGITTKLPRPAVFGSAADASPELHFLVGRDHELAGRVEEAAAAYGRALALDPESPYLLRKLAELSARRNRIDEALGFAERALALEPEDLGTRLFLGTLYRFQKNVDRADQVLRDAEGEPLNPDAALLLYGLLAEAERFDEAKSTALWLQNAEPDGLRGIFALADVQQRMGDHAAGEAALREGLRHFPGELTLYGALARARRDRGDREGEIEIHREVLEKHPDHHTTQLALADALLDLERVDEAAEVLRRVEARYPDDLRTVLRLGFLEFERRDYAEAARRFATALAVNPSQHEVTYFLGIVQRRQREFDLALETFARIPPDHERYLEARTQIAAIYEARGDYAEALREIEGARARGSSRPLDLYLASLRAKTGDQAGALAFLEELLAENPGDAELLYNIGVLHGEAQEVDLSLQYMQRVLDVDPDHAGALNYVGYTWAERGTNLDRAEEYVVRALELRPDDGYITDSLGWIYYMRARPLIEAGERGDGSVYLDRAVSELERAHELTGGDPVVLEHLGDAYLLLGEKQRALESYREAVELGPRESEQPDLPGKLEDLERELGLR